MNDAELLAEVNRLLSLGQRVVMATVVRTQGSTPRKAGAKMIVREDGSCAGTICGGCVEAEVYAKAKELFRKPRPIVMPFSLNDDAAAEYGLRCGGVMEVYVERILPKFQLWICGAGHIGQALASIVSKLNFDVHVIDDHPGFANEDHFPSCGIHVAEFDRAATLVPQGSHVCVVIATRGHKQDADVFHALVNHNLGYFGLVASWKRLVDFYKPLLSAGIPVDRLRKIAAPVGLDIGSESPEEIAVAIAAEILAAMKGGKGESLAKQFWDSPAAKKLPELAAGLQE